VDLLLPSACGAIEGIAPQDEMWDFRDMSLLE